MLYVIVGATCSGKTTTIKRLKELGFKTVVNYTTRPKRDNEIDGEDYNFVSVAKYNNLDEKGLLIAKRFFKSVYGTVWHYALNLNDIDVNRDSILVVDPKGYDELIENVGRENIKGIYLKISYEIRLSRGLERHDDFDELNRRLTADEIDFYDMEKKIDYIITASEPDEVLNKIVSIIKENNTTKRKLYLISPLPPSVNKYLNYRVASNSKKKKNNVQAYPSDETKIYKEYFTDYIKDEIKMQQWIKPKKGKLVYVKCIIYFDRKGKDPNNYLKVPFDCFTDAEVYIDDDIALPIVDRVYIDSDNPRIEFEIYESDAIGIFENKDDYQKFLECNCNGCWKKYYGSCSILKDALDNRITEDISDGNCNKRR